LGDAFRNQLKSKKKKIYIISYPELYRDIEITDLLRASLTGKVTRPEQRQCEGKLCFTIRLNLQHVNVSQNRETLVR
jgi:hypothetical protein